MTARAAINQVTQIGVEASFFRHGGSPANKRFPGVQITLKPEVGTKFYRPPALKCRVWVF
jgi:hypothetical protein